MMRGSLLLIAAIVAAPCNRRHDAPEPSASDLVCSAPMETVSATGIATAPPPPAPIESDRGRAEPSEPPRIVRERKRITVDGVEEEWRIEWIGKPDPICFGENRSTCPCTGLVFGEMGT